LQKSTRMVLATMAALAVAAGGTWGAVAMAASSPGTTTPKTHTAPKSQATPKAPAAPRSPSAHHNCPNMGNNAGASTMYHPSSPSDV
jgi:hypothetical protein